jgi:hypothetical protein
LANALGLIRGLLAATELHVSNDLKYDTQRARIQNEEEYLPLK